MTMKNALQEQLLKAGLITQEQLEQSNRPQPRPKAQPETRPRPQGAKQRSPEQRPHGKPGEAASQRRPSVPQKSEVDLKAAYAAKVKAEQEAAQREAELAATRKANKQKLTALIEQNTLNTPEAEFPYQFQVGTTIKKVYVTEAQRQALIAGELAITFLDGRRCLIPATIVDEIRALDPKKIVIIPKSDSDTTAEDDPYAQFKVPDDLMW